MFCTVLECTVPSSALVHMKIAPKGKRRNFSPSPAPPPAVRTDNWKESISRKRDIFRGKGD